MIATRLPQLEVLILLIPVFSNRPRRKDNGLNGVQNVAAVSFFENCPVLNIILFNGIPDIQDPIGRFPTRVWTRDSKEGGAHMAGRAALP